MLTSKPSKTVLTITADNHDLTFSELEIFNALNAIRAMQIELDKRNSDVPLDTLIAFLLDGKVKTERTETI